MTNVIRAPFGAASPAAAEPFDREVTDPAPRRPEDDGGPRGPRDKGPDRPGDDARFGPVVPLGTAYSRGRKAYVFLDADGERQAFTARDLVQRANLLSLFGGVDGRDTLVTLWPESTRGNRKGADDFDAETAGAWLMQACGRLGPAEAVELRLGGVWPHAGGLLVHCGNTLLHGEDEHAPGLRDGARIYVACQKRPRPADQAATRDDVAKLAADLKLWTFAPEHAGIATEVLLGLIACGIYGIAIAWRPHVFLRGERNAGKSSLCRLVAYACGAGEPADDLSPAGLRRMFNARSGLIPLDERENDAAGVEGVVKIMRGASDGEGNVTIQADMDGGGTATFRVGGSFLMAATTLPALTSADASRITILQIRAGATDQRAKVEAAQQRARALYPALLKRLVEAWPRWRTNWLAAREAAGTLSATSRSMDQVGALVAGWWTLAQDRPLTLVEAKREMHRFADLLTTREESAEDGAGRAVLLHLLGSRIQVAERTSDQMTVQAAIEKAMRAQTDPEWMADENRTKRQLGANGLFVNATGKSGHGWPWPFPGDPRPGLLVATELPQLRALFHSSDWPRVAWREPLRDLPGVEISRRSMKFPAGGLSRAVFIPLGLLGVTDDDIAAGGG